MTRLFSLRNDVYTSVDAYCVCVLVCVCDIYRNMIHICSVYIYIYTPILYAVNVIVR